MVRISKTFKMINIDSYLEDIRKYFADGKDVAAAFLFGSYGTPYQTALSDVDMAVLFVPHKNIDIEIEISLLADLSEITKEEDINLLVLNKAPLPLQFEVLSTGKVLIQKGLYLEDFHEYVCKRYADYKIDLDQFNLDYDDALREVYLDGQSGQNP